MKWYANGGKRYYVIAVHGGEINPRSGFTSGGRPVGVTYAVLDRDVMHKEVGRFATTRGGSSASFHKGRAEALAKRLNAQEART